MSEQRCAIPPMVAVLHATTAYYKLLSFCRLPAGKPETALHLKPQWSYYSNPQGFTLNPHWRSHFDHTVNKFRLLNNRICEKPSHVHISLHGSAHLLYTLPQLFNEVLPRCRSTYFLFLLKMFPLRTLWWFSILHLTDNLKSFFRIPFYCVFVDLGGN